MQLASSRIWTRVAVSIFYDDNHYISGNTVYVTGKLFTCVITFHLSDFSKYFKVFLKFTNYVNNFYFLNS